MLDDEPAIGSEQSRRREHGSPPTDIWDRDHREFIDSPAKPEKSYLFLFVQFLICLTIGLSVPYALKWGYYHFYANNVDLALTNLVFKTDGALTQEELIEAAEIQFGTSLAKLNLADLKSRITAIPQVESAVVEREFPNSLAISVTERKAIAWLSMPIHQVRPLRQGGMVIDANLIAFRCHKLSDSMLKLPTIEAHPNNVPREGQRIDSQFVRSGMQLIKSAPQLAALFDLELVDIRPVGNWGVLCRYSNNLLATFDLSQLERGERDFLKILKSTHAKGLTLETINLAPTKNIPVTFRNKNVEW